MVLLYILIRLVLCTKSKGLCRRVAGALKIHSSSDENRRVTGSGNVVNINIKLCTQRIIVFRDGILQ